MHHFGDEAIGKLNHGVFYPASESGGFCLLVYSYIVQIYMRVLIHVFTFYTLLRGLGKFTTPELING